jgi:hypothetical protein
MPRHYIGERTAHDLGISKNSVVLRIAETGHTEHPGLSRFSVAYGGLIENDGFYCVQVSLIGSA